MADAICNTYITGGISAIGYALFLISEVLGMKSNKANKCTSLLQGAAASGLWVYWRICEMFGIQSQIPQNNATTFDNASLAAANNLTIKLPSWRHHIDDPSAMRPTDITYPPGLTGSAPPKRPILGDTFSPMNTINLNTTNTINPDLPNTTGTMGSPNPSPGLPSGSGITSRRPSSVYKVTVTYETEDPSVIGQPITGQPPV